MLKKLTYILFFSAILMLSACKGNDLLQVDMSPIAKAEIETDDYGDTSISFSPLRMSFSGGAVSPAKLDIIGQTIKEGVSISPQMAGNWVWQDEYTLVFTPDTDWTPNTEYTIKVAGNVFASAYSKDDRSYKIKSPASTSEITNSTLSQTPNGRTVKGVITVSFSHKVDAEAFRKSAKMMLEDMPIGFSIEYADSGYKAYISSNDVPITERAKQLLFTASVASTNLRSSLAVPSLESVFKVSSIDTIFMRDDKFEPQQIVSVSFTGEVAAEQLKDKLEMYLIPKRGTKVDDLEYFNTAGGFSGYKVLPEMVDNYISNGKLLNYRVLPQATNSMDVHNFIIDVEDASGSYLVAVVRSGVSSVSGFSLKNPYATILAIPAYPVEVYINSDGAILTPTSPEIVNISARGISAVKVEIGALLPEQLQHVISSTYSGGFNSDFKYDNGIDAENIAMFSEEIIPLAARSKKETSYAAVDLSKYSHKSSFFFIRVTGLDKNRNIVTSPVSKTILLTDMALIWKANLGGTSGVYVFSISKGEPVPYAGINIIGKNGLSIYNTTANDEGYAQVPSLSGYSRDRKPIALTASKGRDLTFIPIENYRRSVDYSRFDVGGVYSGDDALRAYLTTGRGIYRPGESVDIAGIIKQKDWAKLGGVPVEAVILDPDEKQVLVKRFSLTDEALFDIIFKTSTSMMTGSYEVMLYLIKNGEQRDVLGYSSFKLSEFEPDTMRLKVNINGKSIKGWQKPENIKAYAKSENMFGTPAPDRPVKWRTEVTPAVFRFKEYSAFTFTDPASDTRAYRQRRVDVQLADSVTDANGEASQNFDVAAFPQGTYRLTLYADAFMPESGDSVSSGDSALISPLDYIIGYKSSADLRFVKRGSSHELTFVAINNELEPMKVDNVTMTLLRVENIRTLVKGTDGAYKYMSVEKMIPVSETKGLSIKAAGYDTQLPTKDAGRYIFAVTDEKGVTLSQVRYFVSGESNVRLAVDKNAELAITLEKQAYKPGDVINMSVIAPYAGVGLITLERDKVYARKWFRTTSTASEQSITIPSDMEGGGYVNISMVRDMKSPEVFMNPYSYAAVPFRLDTSARRINIDIEVPEVSRPSDTMKIKYTADKDAQLILFGTDEGILQVARYEYPNTIGFFFRKQALQVRTYQTADLILPDYTVLRQAAMAGGGEAGDFNVRLNPFARKQAKPAVFWSGVMSVKAGEAYYYDFVVPETFNGNIKIMAIASSASAVGDVVKDAVVRSPVVITPSAPASVAPNDIFEIPVTLANNIEASSGQDNITVSASVSAHLELVSVKDVAVDIAKGGERTVVYKFKALEKPGAASVVFSVASASLDKPAKISAQLSVRPPVEYVRTLNVGRFDSSTHTLKAMFSDIYDEYALRVAGASSNPLTAAAGAGQYLSTYPHGCTEQLISRVIPLIYLGGGSKLDSVKNLIDTIRSRQRTSGGFSYWDEMPEQDPFVTVYAMNMLIDAKEAGISVPEQTMKRGISFLNEMLLTEPKGNFSAQIHAHAIYLLARSGIVVSRQINRLDEYLKSVPTYKWQETLTGSYIGSAYSVMKNDAKGEELLKAFKPDGKNYIFYSDFETSSTRNSQYMYLVSRHAPTLAPRLALLADGLLSSISQGFYNTIDSAYAVMALQAYGASKMDTAQPKFEGVNAAGEKYTPEFLKDSRTDINFLGGTKEMQIAFTDPSTMGYFWYVLQNGYPKALPQAYSKGLEITKEYLDKSGAKVTTIFAGAEVTVRLRIRVTGNDVAASNIVITDLLPGGFEVIRGSVSAKSDHFLRNDIREDRVLFYSQLYNTSVLEITYRARATSVGEFVVPAAYVESMYKTDVKANSKPERLNVINDRK